MYINQSIKGLFTFLSISLLCSVSFWTLADETVELLIESPFVELHSGPGVGYPILYVVEKGEKISILLKRTSWLKVADKRGNIGWLPQASLLKLSKSGQQVDSEQDYGFDDYQARHWEGGVLYGDLEGANFFNIYAAYAFSSVMSAELMLGKALGDISDSDVAELMLVAQPFPDWWVTPYMGIGAGVIKTTPHSVLAKAENRENTLISGAIGMKYHVARNFLVRLEFKNALVLTERDENEEIQTWKIGFSVFF